MTLRKKTLLISVSALAGLVLLLALAYRYYLINRISLQSLILSMVLASLACLVIANIMFEKTVIAKLVKLSNDVRKISRHGSTVRRLTVDQEHSELTVLSENINNMLEALEISRLLAQEKEASLRLITDNMMDIISQVDYEGNILYASPSHFLTLGHKSKELLNQPVFDLIHNDDVSRFQTFLQKGIETHMMQRGEFRIRHAAGHFLWMEGIGKVFFKDGTYKGAILSFRDVTERREMEERLKQLSLQDSLTGLYNRTYFEQEMHRLKSSRLLPIGLIICDVDGLKFCNDSLGHETGDKLLQAVANIIKVCFRQEDIVARIGGDEFAILLPSSPRETVSGACRRIRESIAGFNENNKALTLSVSIGFAIADSPEQVNSLFTEADKNMYREKLYRSKSARNTVLQTMLKALKARDSITETHTDRLQNLVIGFARVLGLSGQKLTDLRLFIQFHDLGKVGVPDRVLLNTDLLTHEEQREMQRHCAIGHRIALSAPDLAPIADWILKHHEWWNGQGYPTGLSGEEIPLECRILAIADAYDAMTSGRPYRKAIPHTEAILELRRCAGEQFDPQLVEMFLDNIDEISVAS